MTADKKIITPEEAAEELLRRRRARTNLAEYIGYVSGKTPPRHNQFLCKKLHDVMTRKIPRLMVFMPPGHAKTFTVSWHFPAFYLAQPEFAEHNIIATTHTDKFSEQNGMRVRNIVASDEHALLFPDVRVSEQSSANARWETTKGGTYNGFGVGATVVGRRADGIIMDDVVAGMAAADSQADRDFLWSWYGGDLYTRLKPGGFIILVMTRYHLDDIAGRLLAASKQPHGERWDVLSFPGLAKEKDPLGRAPGEALWPEWQDEVALTKIKNQPAMSARMWSALYQQEPVQEGGNIIRREWFKIWNQKETPPLEFIVQSWDTASSAEDAAAYSACVTLGIFKEPDTGLPAVILLSVYRERLVYADLRPMAQRLASNYLDDNRKLPMEGGFKREPHQVLVEDKSSGLPLISDLLRAGVPVRRFRPEKYGSKERRLDLVSDIFANGRFYVPGIAPQFTMPRKWADEYMTRLCAFPAIASRDDADATSQALLHLRSTGWVHNTDDPIRDEPIRSYANVGQPLY